MKKFLIALALLFILPLCSCKEKESSPQTELPNYSYSCKNKNGGEISLSFKDNKAIIKTTDKYYRSTVEGYYALTEDEIFIIDDSSGVKYTMKYSLSGDKVTLTYGCYKNTLYKNDSK